MLSGDSAVPLLVEDSRFLEEAVKLSDKYGFMLSDDAAMTADISPVVLLLDVSGLSLVNKDDFKERVQVDFVNGRSGFRLSTMSNTAQPVLRAVGYNKQRLNWRVLDATAGLGVDGMTMAAAGCTVTMVERSTVMAALLGDGLRRAKDDELLQEVCRRVELQRQESLKYLSGVEAAAFDVIYLDPMFPQRRKSSKVKKEMRLTRQVTIEEDNAEELLSAALATSVKRVVLKRPLKSPLLHSGISSQIKGKSIRFDIFLR